MALDTFNPYLFVSAGEQSNKFLTPTYADGIAKFQAQRAQELTGLTIRIDLIQEGTGDPSQENIRPISGRTGLTVTRAGKNLADTSNLAVRTANNVTFTPNSDGSISVTINGSASASATYDIPCELVDGVTYTASGITDGSSTTYQVYLQNPAGLGTNAGNFVTGSKTFTKDSENYNVGKYRIRVSSGCTGAFTIYPQIEIGPSATAYEPYTAQTYPVTWETEAGTVYGGTLDVVSGVLTVDWDYIASYDGETLPGEWISDRDVYEEGTTPTTGAEVAYKLADPVTYQLDPEQAMTAPGFNQVYSDAGPVIDIQF